MKKILILGLLLVSHLWGLKELGDDIYSNREEWCLETYPDEESRDWCETKTPTLPNDYKPTKEDKVLKVKVGNVEGEIVGVEGKGIFIRASSQKDFSYVDGLGNPSELFLINYPQYSIVVKIDNSGDRNIEDENGTGGGSVVEIYQIFEVTNDLKAFLIQIEDTKWCNSDNDSPCPYTKNVKWCNFSDNDSPCPYTKNDVLDWIKKQGGQEYFDYTCPQFYDDLNDICNQGIIRERRGGEWDRRDRITG